MWAARYRFTFCQNVRTCLDMIFVLQWIWTARDGWVNSTYYFNPMSWSSGEGPGAGLLTGVFIWPVGAGDGPTHAVHNVITAGCKRHLWQSITRDIQSSQTALSSYEQCTLNAENHSDTQSPAFPNPFMHSLSLISSCSFLSTAASIFLFLPTMGRRSLKISRRWLVSASWNRWRSFRSCLELKG